MLLLPALTYFLLLFLISLRRWCLGFCNWVVQSPGTDDEGRLPLEAAPLMLSSESEPGVKFVCMYVCMYAARSSSSLNLFNKPGAINSTHNFIVVLGPIIWNGDDDEGCSAIFSIFYFF